MEAEDLKVTDTAKIVELLKGGKVGVMPTDTIYGIVGSAVNPQTVENIYFLRKRDVSKPMIILISSLDDLSGFNITLSDEQKQLLIQIWPNPVSVILACPYIKFSYLHRGKNSLAFRMPDNKKLLSVVNRVGPIVAPSANIEDAKPAESISQAKKYFDNKIAFYVDAGILKSQPSTIVQLFEDGTRIVLRKGSFNI